jgi:hypothetical protein
MVDVEPVMLHLTFPPPEAGAESVGYPIALTPG